MDIVAADVIDELDVDGLIQLYTDEITAVPVSYTHLTLPTIYSV